MNEYKIGQVVLSTQGRKPEQIKHAYVITHPHGVDGKPVGKIIELSEQQYQALERQEVLPDELILEGFGGGEIEGNVTPTKIVLEDSQILNAYSLGVRREFSSFNLSQEALDSAVTPQVAALAAELQSARRSVSPATPVTQRRSV